ncbi:larval cuticle protein 1 [Culex quinquefasciatus]|uniref:larval cuticle protein 1 n=1 Tax=Culex quinquefasciatus TaxID=7176 RepID=UPI0018E341BC|nr:larval cuticle protein 1 [Culex quinquefasciatus]XP_039446429.1 larval cuticle protein 1-like [Culex pipiens pallens]
MAKFLLISGAVCLLVSQIYAAPLNEDERKKLSFGARFDPSEVQVVRYENDHNALDNYQFNFALSDDQTREEVGTLKDGKDQEGNNVRFYVVQGSYSFLGDDGQTHWVHYTADETGYHPRLGTGPDPEKKY